MSETELKIALGPRQAAQLHARLIRLSPDARPRGLHSVYYDTQDQRLRKAGLALRLRRDGEDWIQTVKAKASNASGLQRVHEAECTLPGRGLSLKRIPDKALRKTIRARIKKSDLTAICETRMERFTQMMYGPQEAVIEVALDEGEIRAGPQSAPFCELEMELKRGDVGALYDLALELLPDGGLDFSRLSKSARGDLLAQTGQLAPPCAPRRARSVPLTRKMTASQAAQSLLRECYDQIASNLETVRKNDDPEGPHQLRIGLRRLRAAFDLFAPLLPKPERARLLAEAKWLGRLVGQQRDLDVALGDVLAPALAEAPDRAALERVHAALEQRATENRQRLRDILETTRTQRFALDLGRYVESRAWESGARKAQRKAQAQPFGQLATAALDRVWTKVNRRAKGIGGHDIEQRHALRKALKSLRYTVEFTAPIYGGKAQAQSQATFTKRLKKLQGLFGDLNDLAMAEKLLGGADGPLAQDRSLQAALAWMGARAQSQSTDQWPRAKARWRDVKRAPAYWR